MTSKRREELLEKLHDMKAIPITDIDPETVSELCDIKFRNNMPPEKRVMSLIEQTDNPYVYRDGGVLVKVSFADKGLTLQSCMEEYLTAEMMLNR